MEDILINNWSLTSEEKIGLITLSLRAEIRCPAADELLSGLMVGVPATNDNLKSFILFKEEYGAFFLL